MAIGQDPLECFLSWNTWKGIVPAWCPDLSGECWESVGQCRMSQFIELVCSIEVPESDDSGNKNGSSSKLGNAFPRCSRHFGKQNLALLTTSQTAQPKALAAAARFLGLRPEIYGQASLQYMNVGKLGRVGALWERLVHVQQFVLLLFIYVYIYIISCLNILLWRWKLAERNKRVSVFPKDGTTRRCCVDHRWQRRGGVCERFFSASTACWRRFCANFNW